jgi:hypothetical protein
MSAWILFSSESLMERNKHLPKYSQVNVDRSKIAQILSIEKWKDDLLNNAILGYYYNNYA